MMKMKYPAWEVLEKRLPRSGFAQYCGNHVTPGRHLTLNFWSNKITFLVFEYISEYIYLEIYISGL